MTQKEPVLVNGTVAALFAALTPVLVYFGVNASSLGRWGSLVGAAATLLLAVWHLFSARSKVTPVQGVSLIVQLEGDAQKVLAALKAAETPAPVSVPTDPVPPVPRSSQQHAPPCPRCERLGPPAPT